MGSIRGAIALLCLLASAVLAARRAPRAGMAGLAAAAFALPLTAFMLLPLAVLPAASAAFIALGCGFDLLRAPHWRWSALASGLAAALAALLWHDAGLPAWLAAGLAPLAVVAGLTLPRQAARNDARLRDEALIGLAWGGLLLALAPTLAEGWTSAAALNLSAGGEVSPGAPAGVWIFLALAVSAGLLRGWWTRR